MKTFKFSLVLRTRENTDVFISLDDNIYGIHSKKSKYPLYFHQIYTDFTADNKINCFRLYSIYLMNLSTKRDISHV